jgi:hypothetical protein
LETQTTTIQITRRTKHELLRIKGELLKKDGVERTFDDILQELIFYWVRGVKKQGYRG